MLACAPPYKPITSQRGASLIELIAIAVLVMAFIGTATIKIWELRIAAEKTGIEYMLGTIRSALGIQVVATITQQGISGLSHYYLSNPMDYLERLPSNYLGEFDGPPQAPTVGAWYFDRKQAALVYHVRFAEYLVNDNYRHPELIRFQVQMRYNDVNNNGTFDPAIDAPSALGLVALDHYHWVSLDEEPGATPSPRE